jgi:hypothetical protein
MLNVARAESFIITENPFNNGDPLISAADEKKRQRILLLAVIVIQSL